MANKSVGREEHTMGHYKVHVETLTADDRAGKVYGLLLRVGGQIEQDERCEDHDVQGACEAWQTEATKDMDGLTYNLPDAWKCQRVAIDRVSGGGGARGYRCTWRFFLASAKPSDTQPLSPKQALSDCGIGAADFARAMAGAWGEQVCAVDSAVQDVTVARVADALRERATEQALRVTHYRSRLAGLRAEVLAEAREQVRMVDGWGWADGAEAGLSDDDRALAGRLALDWCREPSNMPRGSQSVYRLVEQVRAERK